MVFSLLSYFVYLYKKNVWKINKEYFEQITNFKKSRHFRSIIISHGKKNHRYMFCFGVFFLILKSELMSFSDDLLLLFIYVLFGSCFCILHKYIFYTSVVIVLVDRSLIAIYTQNNYRYSTFASNLVSLSSCISDNLLRIMSIFKWILIIYFRSKKATFYNSLVSLVE